MMCTKMALILGLASMALASSGCKSLGLVDESMKDYSGENTKDGEVLKLPAPQRVVVQKIERDFVSSPAKVKISLKNEGELYEIFSADLELAYPAPAGSFAPYTPEFIAVDIPAFGKGDVKEIVIEGPKGAVGTPYYAKLLVSSGAEVRMTAAREKSIRGNRQGTLLLAGKVEVVAVDCLLTSDKPSLAFTIENISKEEIGNLRYMVQFFKDGKQVELGRRLSGIRPVGKPLGKPGSQVTIEVAGLESVEGLAGAMPVLRIIQ